MFASLAPARKAMASLSPVLAGHIQQLKLSPVGF
jgi:hypothetical protein